MEKESLYKKAGEQLKQYRKKTGNSIFKVARRINISGNYLSELERGLKEPSDTVLEAIAEYYGLPLDKTFALYDRIAPVETTLLLNNPTLNKTLVQISIDDRLTAEEQKHLSNEFKKLYDDLVKDK